MTRGTTARLLCKRASRSNIVSCEHLFSPAAQSGSRTGYFLYLGSSMLARVILLQIHFSSIGHILLSTTTSKRLLMACAMGGAIGLEREWRHKDSGLRTNMLICMGAALFTLVGAVLAGDSPDKSRVASNIVQGIGFLGAGLILHAKNHVIGLTSAATVFCVAAIGMTCGTGLYLEAFFSTLILLLALQVVGALEYKIGWKRYSMVYEVRAAIGGAEPAANVLDAAMQESARYRMLSAVLKVMDDAGQRMQILDRDTIAGLERISFSITGTRKEHAHLLGQLKASDATDTVIVFRDPNDE